MKLRKFAAPAAILFGLGTTLAVAPAFASPDRSGVERPNKPERPHKAEKPEKPERPHHH